MLGLECHRRSQPSGRQRRIRATLRVRVRRHDDLTGGGKTEITGAIIDQSHLLGLLERISGLGLSLYSVTPLDSGNGESGTAR